MATNIGEAPYYTDAAGNRFPAQGIFTGGVPVFVQMNRGTFQMQPDTLTADTAKTIFPLDANRIGVEVLNFGAEAVFFTVGTTGEPPTGPGSDYAPAAVGTVPGRWAPRYSCVSGVRAISGSAAGLTLMSW